jgi:hypothetical protein
MPHHEIMNGLLMSKSGKPHGNRGLSENFQDVHNITLLLPRNNAMKYSS